MGFYTSEQLAWLIRRHGVEMTHVSGGSHIGSVLSVADIIAVLYADVARTDPKYPKWEKRDRIILGKGHAGAAIYAALAEAGFFPVEKLKTHYANGSILSGHVSHKGVPGVELSTGSLGHGLSVGAGMAMAVKMNHENHNIYVICGDGECDEGSIWEAALFAGHYKLDSLFAVIDHNKMQSLDYCDKTLKLSPFADKWRAFGWNVITTDGHNHDELKGAFKSAANKAGRPTVIIADTVKGKGISFMENDILWHYRFPHDGWEYDTAVNELHMVKPQGANDPYTPNGIANPAAYDGSSDTEEDHTMSSGWHPTWITAERESY